MFGKPARSSSGNGKAEVKDSAPCRKSIRLTVAPDTIGPVRATVVGEFQRQATLAGFRKGKAPADLVQKQHAKDIEGETRQRLMQQALEQATKEHGLKPVGPFEIGTATLTPGSARPIYPARSPPPLGARSAHLEENAWPVK
jgi:FKBP-type peptidyl-prolyl cis-trans isomerase (trigger factor)